MLSCSCLVICCSFCCMVLSWDDEFDKISRSGPRPQNRSMLSIKVNSKLSHAVFSHELRESDRGPAIVMFFSCFKGVEESFKMFLWTFSFMVSCVVGANVCHHSTHVGISVRGRVWAQYFKWFWPAEELWTGGSMNTTIQPHQHRPQVCGTVCNHGHSCICTMMEDGEVTHLFSPLALL